MTLQIGLRKHKLTQITWQQSPEWNRSIQPAKDLSSPGPKYFLVCFFFLKANSGNYSWLLTMSRCVIRSNKAQVCRIYSSQL